MLHMRNNRLSGVISKMYAMRIDSPGAGGRLVPCTLPLLTPEPHQVRIRVAYAGLNRADLFQVAGTYPAPSEHDFVPGLEVSGAIDALGESVTGWTMGDAACALVTGGGYAEYCLVDAALLFPIPASYTMQEAAALPEALLTNWLALVHHGEVKAEDFVLVTGGSSGIGTFAIPMLRTLNARPIALAGNPEKQALCRRLGAETLDYHSTSLSADIMALTEGKGAAVVLDMLGGAFHEVAMQCLHPGGRLISIAFLQGSRLEVNAGRLLMKNLRWQGMSLRSQPTAFKAALGREALETLGPAMASGALKPTLDHVFPLKDAEKAHARMQQRLHIGKILLEVGA